MIRKIVTAAVIAGASLAFVGVAQAEDIPATPMNPGAPNNIPGMNVVPGMGMAIGAVGQGMNVVGDVAAGPMGAVNTAMGNPPPPAAEGAPMHRHRMMHHHMHKKMMMKKKMMKKEM